MRNGGQCAPRSIVAKGLLSLLLVFLKTVFSEVLVDPSGRIDKLLLTGIEGMASRTDIKSVVALCGLSMNFIATSAGENSLSVRGMYIFFHLLSSSLKTAVSYS